MTFQTWNSICASWVDFLCLLDFYFFKYFNIWLRKTNTLKRLVMLQMTVKWPANLFQGKSNSWATVSIWFLALDFLSSSGDTRSLICRFWDFRKWNLHKTSRTLTPFWINNNKKRTANLLKSLSDFSFFSEVCWFSLKPQPFEYMNSFWKFMQ